jgi:glutamate racemase
MRIGGAREDADGVCPRLPLIASPALQAEAGRGGPAALPISLLGPPAMPRLLPAPTILVFDSGLGGLTVFREIARARPDARLIYAADDALFPYSQVEETALVERVLAVMDELIAEHRPDLAVIACNTASTLVLPALRGRFDLPFVGTVPAIKPACASSVTRRVSVLGTEATVRREYTQALIRQYGGDCRVTLVGSARLAGFAEAELSGSPADDDAIRDEILPCFVDDGSRTDTIVLACTHYPLLTGRLERGAWSTSSARQGPGRRGLRRSRYSRPAAPPPPPWPRRSPSFGWPSLCGPHPPPAIGRCRAFDSVCRSA